jgi:hypothetical protein
MPHNISALAGKDTGNHQQARLGAEHTRGDAFFHAGNTQPAGSTAHCRWSANTK